MFLCWRGVLPSLRDQELVVAYLFANELGEDLPSYFAQNDGTFMAPDNASRYPVLTIWSAPATGYAEQPSCPQSPTRSSSTWEAPPATRDA